MSEQLLDDPDVRAAVEQVGGEGVRRGMGGNIGFAGTSGCFAQDPPRALPGEPAAAGVEEDAGARLPRGLARERRAAPDQVGVKRLDRVAADRDVALLAALAGQQDGRVPLEGM